MRACPTPVRSLLWLVVPALLVGPAPAPAAKGDPAPDPEPRAQIGPRPVPGVPGPWECPEVRGPGPTVATAPVQPPPQTPPAGEDGRGEERRPQATEARPQPPPPPPRGTIAGEVVVRDRGGRDKGDRS